MEREKNTRNEFKKLETNKKNNIFCKCAIVLEKKLFIEYNYIMQLCLV